MEMWNLIKTIFFALLTYWREKEEQKEEERQRRKAGLDGRDREIAVEVEHERQQVEETLEKAGRDARAYRDAFERVRRQQQSG
jgi:hypothetical protein